MTDVLADAPDSPDGLSRAYTTAGAVSTIDVTVSSAMPRAFGRYDAKPPVPRTPRTSPACVTPAW